MIRIRSEKYLRASAFLGMSFVLLFAGIALANISLPIPDAKAQENDGATWQSNGTIQVSFEYIRNVVYYGDKEYARYTGSAILTPVDGGYEGSGTGTYEGLDELPPFDPCTEPQRTAYVGTADLTVN